MSELTLTIWTLAVILAFALAIGWMVLPFAIIGTKPLLKELIDEARLTNKLLQEMQQHGVTAASETVTSASPSPTETNVPLRVIQVPLRDRKSSGKS